VQGKIDKSPIPPMEKTFLSLLANLALIDGNRFGAYELS
jgi:hypothetical protein